MALKNKIKQGKNNKKRHKLFSKSFKIVINRGPKKAHKAKIVLKDLLANMQIADNNHNTRTYMVSKNMIMRV